MPEQNEFEKDLNIYPDLNRMTFAMDSQDIRWDLIDEEDDSYPSSKSYRRLMHEMGITGRPYRRKPGRMRKDDYWD